MLTEVAISCAVTCVAVLSYAPIAEQHCAGLDAGVHTTLPHTKLLEEYPCNATTASRAAYLLLRCVSVLRDIIVGVDASDRWLAFGNAAVVFRLGATLFLPPDLYKALAVALMYFCRLQFFVFMLLRGPAAEPSYLSMLTAFKLNVVFDLMLFFSTLGCKPPGIVAELAVGTFLTAASGVLHSWHAHRVAQAPALYQLLLTRLVVVAINVTTQRVLLGGGMGRRPRPLIAGAEAASGSAAVVVEGAPARPASKCEGFGDLQPRELGRCSCAAGAGSAAVSLFKASSAAGLAAGAGSVAAASVAAGSPIAAAASGAAWGAHDGSAALRARAPAAAVVAGFAGGRASGPAAVEAAVAPIQALMPNRPYRSIVRRQVVAFKVPWAEPEDIQTGFQQRLAELLAAKGLVLADVSVRRGCIELVMVLQSSSQDKRHQHDGGLDAASLVRTLGLLRGPRRDADGGEDGGAGARDHDVELLAAVRRVRDVVLTRGALAERAGAPQSPRIADVWPRVLHVPPAVRQAGGGPAAVAAAAAGGSVTLRVRVEWPAAAAIGPAGAAPGLATVRVQAPGGVLLPVQVTASRLVSPADAAGVDDTVDTAGGSSVPVLLAEYDIELEALPLRPGAMMLELHGPAAATAAGTGAHPQQAAAAGAPDAHPMLAPMLAVADAAAAEELSVKMSDWPSDLESQLELNELVFDVSTWADAAAAGAWGSGAEWSPLFGCAGLVAADEAVWSELLPHLISYCRAAGWNATANAVEADHTAHAELRGRHAGAGQRGAGGVVSADAAAGSPAAGTTAAAATDVPYELQAAALRKSADFLGDEAHSDLLLLSTGSVAGSILDSGPALLVARHRRPPQAAWRQALLQVLGLSQRETPAEAAAFRAFVCSWTTSLANIAQVTELLMVVALLSRGARAGQVALGGELAIVLTGCGLGAAATLAWALLPAERWRRLALRLRLPRQLGYLLSKSLLGLGLARPPAGALAYAAGPGMLLMEGAILPGACLVSPAAAMAIACIKLPLNVLCSLRLGIAGGSPVAALIIGLRTEVLGLLTNTAFHVYLRMRYQEQAAAAAPVAAAAAAPAPARERAAGDSSGGSGRGAAAARAVAGGAGGSRGAAGLVQRAAATASRDSNGAGAAGNGF